MNIQEWFQLFIQQVKVVPALEWLGVSFGVAEVILAKANKVWLYPSGIISVLISTYIFFHSGLFAESILNLYYFFMSIYGWWWWIKRKHHEAPPITRTNKRDWLITIIITSGSFALIYFLLSWFTNSTVPVWDSWVSATAWAGMWLLAKKKIENWILLNISNAFAIPLLLHKGLPLYAALTLFLFVIAVIGYYDWNKIIKQNNNEQVLSVE